MKSYVKFGKMRIEKGTVNMIYGAGGVGKTTFNYHLMKMIGGNMLYIDTENGRDMDRMTIVAGKVYPEIEDVVSWIELVKKLERYERAGEDYDLIIIDSVASLYSREILNSDSRSGERIRVAGELQRDLANMYINMRKLLRKKMGVGVWVNWESSPLKDALKDKYSDVVARDFLGSKMMDLNPKSIYKFNKVKDRDNERYVEVIKAKNTPEGTKWKYKLTEKGISWV